MEIRTEARRAVFLDRDGVLNRERGDYTWKTGDFEVLSGVAGALKQLKEAGFMLIVVTNQAGIAKGLYTKKDVLACHEKLQKETGGLLDALYMAPGHPSVSESLSRKPGSLMFERAIARFRIRPHASWMVGDKERDLIPARKLGIRCIAIGAATGLEETTAKSLQEAVPYILSQSHN